VVEAALRDGEVGFGTLVTTSSGKLPIAIEAAPSSVSGRSRSQTPLTELSEETTPSAQQGPRQRFSAKIETASPELSRKATTTDGCVSVGFSFLVKSA